MSGVQRRKNVVFKPQIPVRYWLRSDRKSMTQISLAAPPVFEDLLSW
jgi:hypothetical protein